jgi:hypothetical protein
MKKKRRLKKPSAPREKAIAMLMDSVSVRLLLGRWNNLDRLDRAERVQDLAKLGVSNRVLAEVLHVDEGTIRIDRKIAALPCFYKRPLATGISVARTLKDATADDAWEKEDARKRIAFENASDAEKLVQEIIAFFQERGVGSALARQILDEATLQVYRRKNAGFFRGATKSQLERAELIKHTEPRNDGDRKASLDTFYEPLEWLLNWSCARYPNPDLLEQGFKKATLRCEREEIIPFRWPDGLRDLSIVIEEEVAHQLGEMQAVRNLGAQALMPKYHPALQAAKGKPGK